MGGLSSREIALASVMGGLAIALSVARIQFPFPVLTYLKFDAAEIPSFAAYYMSGPVVGYACAFLHFLGLLVRGSNPFGASMKLLAVLSTLAGMHLVRGRGIELEVATGGLSRVVVMTIANIIFMLFLFPNYLDFAARTFRALGINVRTEAETLIVLLVLTGIFNALHTVFSAGLALALVSAVKKRIPSLMRA